MLVMRSSFDNRGVEGGPQPIDLPRGSLGCPQGEILSDTAVVLSKPCVGAGDGTRTRDVLLGRQELYH